MEHTISFNDGTLLYCIVWSILYDNSNNKCTLYTIFTIKYIFKVYELHCSSTLMFYIYICIYKLLYTIFKILQRFKR